MNKVTNIKPSNIAILDSKPKNIVITDNKPHNLKLINPSFIYLEIRTINKGQPLPWGINWALTYPETLIFQGVRP